MPKAYSDYTKQAVIYPWSAVADNNRPLHIPRRSWRIDLRKSIIYNRIDERCARVDYCPRRRTVSNRPIYRENCSRRNQGNRTRFRQVLSEIYRVGLGRKEALLRCLRRTAITRSRRLYTHGAPSRTIIDPCTSLVDPGESIFENRLSIIGSTSDVLGSIIVHDGAPYQTGRYIAKIAAGGIKATGRGFAKFLAKFIESGSVARKPWSGKQSKRN